MDFGGVGSGETGETDHDEDTTPDGRWKSVLGSRSSALGFGDLHVLGVDVEHGKENGNDGSDENTHKGKTADTGVPSSALLEDDRVGGKVEVEHTVDDGNVDTEDDDDWLCKVSSLVGDD